MPLPEPLESIIYTSKVRAQQARQVKQAQSQSQNQSQRGSGSDWGQEMIGLALLIGVPCWVVAYWGTALAWQGPLWLVLGALLLSTIVACVDRLMGRTR